MSKKSTLAFQPAPGFVLAKPLSREEVSNLTTSLALPDKTGKEADSVGIAQVIACGDVRKTRTGWEWPTEDGNPSAYKRYALMPGMLIAYIPFTDAIIMDGFDKHNLVPYRSIMAISPEPVKEADNASGKSA